MKLFIVLFAFVAAVSAFPGYDVAGPWHGSPAWQPSSVWPSPGWQPQPAWPSYSGWHAKPVLAVPHYPQQHHHVEHVQVLHVAQPAAVPALHPHPLKLEAHNHVVRIPLHANKVSHPHLIGVEHYHEPEIHVKPVHGHGHGW